jgi:hypothetical protein
LLAYWQTSSAHNEILHDESVAFAADTTFPESDHAPVVAVPAALNLFTKRADY